MKRGEIWWAELPPPAGRRPVVLHSRDEAYAVRALATVAPVTTRVRQIRSEVALGPDDGLSRPCVANLDTITTIPIAQIRDRIAFLSPEKRRDIDAAIRFALGIEAASG